MSNMFLTENIGGDHIPQFNIDLICNKNIPSHKHMVKLCREVHYMWWWNQELDLQEWDEYRKSKKTRILDFYIGYVQ